MKKVFLFANQNKRWLPAALVVVGLVLFFHRALFALIAPASLELKIQHPPVIMPAIYKVYANDKALDGKYNLFKMLVTNNSSNTARNVEVMYQVPNYIEWKTVMKIPMILPGESVVVNCYPSFSEKIVEKNTTSKERVHIKVKGANISEMENEFAIEIKGRNEFMYSSVPADEIRTWGDMFDNMSLLSCYVTPEDPIIKYFTQKLQEKVLKGETASVTRKDEEGVRFMAGIYAATLASHMVYSGTSGVPSKIDDVVSTVQSIRLPREVLVGKTGLCIELSLLYASIMSAAGMDPVIYLIPGHAYPGFRMNGHYYAIESTGIGGEGIGGSMTTGQAYQAGMKNLAEFFKHANAGDDRYMVVDVRESIKKGALAMELKDDPYLRQRIDEMGKGFEQPDDRQLAENTNGRNSGNSGGGNSGGGNNGGGSESASGYNRFDGIVSFTYPSSWNFKAIPPGMLPAFKYDIVPAGEMGSIEVYDFGSYGLSHPAQAMATIQQYVGQFGFTMQYGEAGQNANGYTLFTGAVSSTVGTLTIAAGFKNTNRGVVGVIVSSHNSLVPQYRTYMNTVINSLK